MRILLDTHVWLWMVAAPERMNASARGRLADRANELYLSAASAWEIAIRDRFGRLPDHHRDPFDRMLIAQALCENLVLHMADEKLLRYPAPCELVG